jgi:hypothetical protein
MIISNNLTSYQYCVSTLQNCRRFSRCRQEESRRLQHGLRASRKIVSCLCLSSLIVARVCVSAHNTLQGESLVSNSLRGIILEKGYLSIARLLGDTIAFSLDSVLLQFHSPEFYLTSSAGGAYSASPVAEKTEQGYHIPAAYKLHRWWKNARQLEPSSVT